MRLRSFNVAVRSIETWPGNLTNARDRRASQFRAGFTDTRDLLDRELHNLNARAVVLQLAVRRDQIRKDETGLLAHVRPDHPGVILSFTTPTGAFSYPCDTFITWQDNVRAIAKTLEKLRAVDRYGVSKHGQQYTGWSQLPPGGQPTSAPMTRTEAAEFIAQHADIDPAAILARWPGDGTTYRRVARKLHPDAGGSTEDFQRLQEAKRVLDGER